ncbi:hypothetical protein EDI_099310 [Entamoeba dispar SAW760]|uniref:Nucleoside transporter n=1 Tax=Entamoeba dispar (strain ATCC PRA-260 / SAW760) TaxID=370354 RepID=B0EQW8_ENTDS|nr:uncharacterized protein EDI_099310 [Entamoeba dispar SAW760]EDR23081.1 hypothetical protein EDI_099310 [Entamoeba dispar SAW760]|eukprot:EDR23081.1 hypothetical protein EDI_099310 [Entamoeba dispar SAW760]
MYFSDIKTDTFLAYFLPMFLTVIVYLFNLVHMKLDYEIDANPKREKDSDEDSNTSEDTNELKLESSSMYYTKINSLPDIHMYVSFSDIISVLKSNWICLLCSIILSIVTFTLFPSLLVETSYTNNSNENTDICLNIILIFWSSDLIFRFIGFIDVKWSNWTLYITTLFRIILLIPILNNYLSNEFISKIESFLITFILASTNGYLSTVIMQNISKKTEKQKALITSNVIFLSLNIGKCMGSVASLIVYELLG